MSSSKAAYAVDDSGNSNLFKISLAQWSLHRAFQNQDLEPENFPLIAAREFEIFGVEYVNSFYMAQKNNATF